MNNECRKDESECPTQTKCPADAPVLCASGLCATAAYNCKIVPNESFLDDLDQFQRQQITNDNCDNNFTPSMNINNNSKIKSIRCSNGQCVSALGLCPTEVTCLPKQIRCWDGS